VPKSQRKKKRHVVAWIREQSGLTQSQFAQLIGASRDTLQSIELGRLPLSERFAYAIAEQTGIKAKWLLANKLEPGKLADPEYVRQQFEDAQTATWEGTYSALLWPRALFFRSYAFFRAVTAEIGYAGFRRLGGINLLEKFCLDLVALIGDKRLRKITYRIARESSFDSEKLYRLVLGDLHELQRNLHEYQKEKSAGE